MGILVKVQAAISDAAWSNMKAQGFSGGWNHDELARAISQAAIDAMFGAGIAAKALSYDHAHEIALELGYPSLTEALEALSESGVG